MVGSFEADSIFYDIKYAPKPARTIIISITTTFTIFIVNFRPLTYPQLVNCATTNNAVRDQLLNPIPPHSYLHISCPNIYNFYSDVHRL
jgi:hypothetical protein